MDHGGGGHVVSVLPFFSDNSHSNPVEACKILCLKRKKITKRPGLAH